MEAFKNVVKKVNNILGVLFPCILFLALFFSFVVTVAYRYVAGKSVVWGNEVAILAYMWIMFFGCGKAMENDEHVVFSLVYDVMSPFAKMAMKLVYNAVLAILMVICFQPCLKALFAIELDLPYKLAFAPFFWMLLNIIVYSAINIKKAIDEYKGSSSSGSKEASV